MKMNRTLIATALTLAVVFSACNKQSAKTNPEATAPVMTEGGLKVAYIDTDTLLAKYQYAVDMEKELRTYGEQQQRYGQQQVDAFQKDYNDYLQNGASMTLTQQQAKEAELKQRAERMQTLEQEIMTKIAERQTTETLKVMNAITAYIREYNAANQQFDVILTKAATLYINPAMDITQEIVDGLNEEYKNLKK